jgi:hypothetical protein
VPISGVVALDEIRQVIETHRLLFQGVVHIAATNPEGRWRKFSYEELKARDKTSLDVFWLRDKSLTDLDNLPEPDELAEEIIENLEAGLDSFRQVLAGLNKVA